ncbi:hypothetical protein [Microlunatus parietis]|uniref:Uncharacterized protein n=1 Tax=Microlunatus parietis TaxID=682979 RepID=A0A7Y9IB41_9ACTN|nr:hypothetical protein [Microlunatus parietis]NYE73580.1 hypothetical protein [Microlunatus parietis]
MSSPTPGPPDPRRQPPRPATAPRKKPNGAPIALLVGGVAVVLVAVIVLVVIFVVPRFGGAPRADLSTPDKAAVAFAEAVRGGDPDEVWALTCFGNDGCIRQHGGAMAKPERLAEIRAEVRARVPRLQAELAGVRFRPSYPGMVVGSFDVPFTTASKPDPPYRTLIFYPYQGRWYYLRSGGGER